MSVHNVQYEIAKASAGGTIAVGGPMTVHVPLLASTDITSRWVWVNTTGTALTVTDIREVHAAKGSDLAAVTLDVLVSSASATGAPSTGTSLLSSALSLKTNDHTITTATLAAAANLTIAAGAKIGLNPTGIPTSYAGGVLVIEMVVSA